MFNYVLVVPRLKTRLFLVIAIRWCINCCSNFGQFQNFAHVRLVQGRRVSLQQIHRPMSFFWRLPRWWCRWRSLCSRACQLPSDLCVIWPKFKRCPKSRGYGRRGRAAIDPLYIRRIGVRVYRDWYILNETSKENEIDGQTYDDRISPEKCAAREKSHRARLWRHVNHTTLRRHVQTRVASARNSSRRAVTCGELVDFRHRDWNPVISLACRQLKPFSDLQAGNIDFSSVIYQSCHVATGNKSNFRFW